MSTTAWVCRSFWAALGNLWDRVVGAALLIYQILFTKTPAAENSA